MSEDKKTEPEVVDLQSDEEDLDISQYISVRMEGDSIFEQEEEDDIVCDDDDVFFDLLLNESDNERGGGNQSESELSPFSASRRKQALMARSFFSNDGVVKAEEEPSYSIDPKLWDSSSYRRRDELPLYMQNPKDYDHDPLKQVRIRRAIITYRHHCEKKLLIIALTKENRELRKQLEKTKLLAVELLGCGCDKNKSADLSLLDEEITVVPPRTYFKGQKQCLATPYNEPWNTTSLGKPEVQQKKPSAPTAAKVPVLILPKATAPTAALSPAPTVAKAPTPIVALSPASTLAKAPARTQSDQKMNVPTTTVDGKPWQLPIVNTNLIPNQSSPNQLHISNSNPRPVYKIVKVVPSNPSPQATMVKIIKITPQAQNQNTTQVQSTVASKFMFVQKLDTTLAAPQSTSPIWPNLKKTSTNIPSPSPSLTASQMVLASRKMSNQLSPSCSVPVSSANFISSSGLRPNQHPQKQMQYTNHYFTPTSGSSPTSGAIPYDKETLWKKIKQEEDVEDSEIEMAIQLDFGKNGTSPSTPPEVRRSRKQSIQENNNRVKINSKEFPSPNPIPAKVGKGGDHNDKDFTNKYGDIIFEILKDGNGQEMWT